MSTDEELLLLAAATLAATISLVAFSSNLALTVTMITSQLHSTSTQVLRHVIPPNAVIGCNTFASWIFSNTFESLQLLHAGVATRCIQ